MELPVKLRLQPSAWVETLRPCLLRTTNRLGAAGPFTINMLAEALPGAKRNHLWLFLSDLVDRGVLEQQGSTYRARTQLSPAAQSDTALKQQHMWNILRGAQGRPSIEIAMLAVLASTRRLVIGEAEASQYVHALLEAGYVRERTEHRYWLPPERNVGPWAPRMMQVQFLVDPNKWTIVRETVAREVGL